MTNKKSIKLGDIFEIPLSDSRKVYAQYVDNNNGPIIRVFNYFKDKNEEFEVKKLKTSDLLFPPVHVGIKDPIRSGMWKVVDNLPIKNYSFEGFLSVHTDLPASPDESVKVRNWFFWNGNEYVSLGNKLPHEYREFESNGVYSADLLLQRIETGFEIYEYAKKHNRFLTEAEINKLYPKQS